MSEIRPFTPTEAFVAHLKHKEELANSIPDEMITVVNQFLAEKFNAHNTVVEIQQDAILVAFLAIFPGAISRHDVFDKGWMDFESRFEKAGWHCTYHKGAYYETWEPYYRFKKKSSIASIGERD